MTFETVALFDAMAGKWYGVLIVQMGRNPARIMDQTDPIYPTQADSPT
jgi:hypothetical protein